MLTDINNSFGVFPFIKKCREKEINGLVGMEFRNVDTLLYIGIARNIAGFGELNQLMTTAIFQKQPLLEKAPMFSQAFVFYPYGTKKIF